jgi:hypothetical protein
LRRSEHNGTGKKNVFGETVYVTDTPLDEFFKDGETLLCYESVSGEFMKGFSDDLLEIINGI